MSQVGQNDTHHERNERDGEEGPMSPYRVLVSLRFVAGSMLASVLLAFSVGRAARLFLLEGPRQAMLTEYRQSTLREPPIGGGKRSQHFDPHLPFLVAKEGEQIPHTKYTSKTFDTAKSTMSSSWLITDREAHWLEGEDDQFPDAPQGDDLDEEELAKTVRAIAAMYDDDEKSMPAGEHLMVDIKNVDGAFLNSEHRLAMAMIAVVDAAHLTLLSYHCHGLEPTGVSCAGILTQNYIAFHTWPNEGVICFDLVAGNGKSLLPVLPVIEERFGVQQAASYHGEVISKPLVRWAHKLRGFRHDPTSISNLFETTDLGCAFTSLLGTAYKEEVASVETDFQRIDVFDVINDDRALEQFRKSLANDDSYESRHRSLFRPDRLLFLDGWIQSRRRDEAAYHEALVQPALFANSKPKNVAIIGGGEGATLREVLKHKTVEQVSMIEIDEQMVIESKKAIPEWSDCSDFVGSAPWCLDDPRTKTYFQDALKWFMDRYSSEAKEQYSDPLDVIILDALDPESEVPFAQALYGNDKFMRSFFESLSDDGILVMQLGEAPRPSSPDETFSKFKNRATTMDMLANLGFESIHTYEESHCGFGAPWTYVIGFKSYATRQRWYATEAQINLEVRKRAVQTHSGDNPFKYFDGSTMAHIYQAPHRTMETVFCRKRPMPEECRVGKYDYDPAIPNIPATSFEVQQSGVSDKAGRGVFTKVDIPAGAYLSAETNVAAVDFEPSTVSLIFDITTLEEGADAEILLTYMDGYGFYSRSLGENPENSVDSGILTFVNHGCRGSYNMGKPTEFDEFTVDLNRIDDKVSGKSHFNTTTFNPVIDRHLRYQADRSLHDIKANEEVLDNYLDFDGTGNITEFKIFVEDLRAQCKGEKAGSVIDYEADAAAAVAKENGEL